MHDSDEEKDPQLLAIFATEQSARNNPEFTNQVLRAMRRRDTLKLALVICFGLLVMLAAWSIGSSSWAKFAALLNTELFNLAEGRIGVILGPLNSMLAISAILWLGMVLIWKRIQTASNSQHDL